MSAGLAVVWQVSFLNRFCWIWSSGVVINTLKFSWMKRTCDVSKVFSQIEWLQVDIKSLKYRKESFCSIIRYWYNKPKFTPVTYRNCVIQHRQVVITSIWNLKGPQIELFLTKNMIKCHSFTENRIHNLCVIGQLVVPLWYQCIV